MPVNIYSFAIGLSLAEKEFEQQGVSNPGRAKQLALLAAVFSPADGGGIGASVLPAVLIQQTARREAEEAAANARKAALASATGPRQGTGSGDTNQSTQGTNQNPPSGTTQSGSTQSGSTQSGTTQSGTTQSGTNQPGGTQSGTTQSGSSQSGSTQSGSSQSGATTQAGHTGGGAGTT